MSDHPKDYSMCSEMAYDTSRAPSAYQSLNYKLYGLQATPKPTQRTQTAPGCSSNKQTMAVHDLKEGQPPPRFIEEDQVSTQQASSMQQASLLKNFNRNQTTKHQHYTSPYHQSYPTAAASANATTATNQFTATSKTTTATRPQLQQQQQQLQYVPLPTQFSDNYQPTQFSDNYQPADHSNDQQKFMHEVVARLQALKKNGASNSSHYKTLGMPSDHIENTRAVLSNHFSNHFSNYQKPSRTVKRTKNESANVTAAPAAIKQTKPVKAFCTYVEFDGSKKTEITSYLLKPRSNTLRDLKRVLPSRVEGSKIFFRNQDNTMEQADYEDQQLHASKHKDGSDIIMCEIFVPKTLVPRLDI